MTHSKPSVTQSKPRKKLAVGGAVAALAVLWPLALGPATASAADSAASSNVLQPVPTRAPAVQATASRHGRAGALTNPTEALHESASAIGCVSSKVCLVVGGAPGRPPSAEVAEVVGGLPVAYRKVPGLSGLDGISCPGAMSPCEAVGFAPSGDYGVEISPSGVPGKPFSLPDFFTSISCYRSLAWCEAVGSLYQKGLALISVKDGTPGTARDVRAPRAGGVSNPEISCGSAGWCEVAGSYYADGSDFNSFALAVPSGVPGTAVTVSKAYGIDGISCPAVGQCFVAASSSSGAAMVAALTGVSLGAPHVVGQASSLSAIACSSQASCTAVGSSQSLANPKGRSLVVPVASGVPGTAQTVSAAANLYSVAAVAPTFYAAVGMVASGMNAGDDIVTSS